MTLWLRWDSRAAAKISWVAMASSGVAQPKRSPSSPARSMRKAAHICWMTSGKPGSKMPPVRERCAAADLDEPFVDVADLCVPGVCFVEIEGIVRKQRAVVAEMCPAAAGVGDDGVEIFRRDKVDHAPGQRGGECGFAVVGVERAAARLHGRGVDGAAIR